MPVGPLCCSVSCCQLSYFIAKYGYFQSSLLGKISKFVIGLKSGYFTYILS